MVEEHTPLAPPLSTEFYSARIESLREAMGTLDMNDEEGKVDAEIEASKVHWSELKSDFFSVAESAAVESSSISKLETMSEEGSPEWYLKVAKDNVEVFRSLQEQYPGGFFLNEGALDPDDMDMLPGWINELFGKLGLVEFGLSSEKPFAEGAQAQLFHTHRIYIPGNLIWL